MQETTIEYDRYGRMKYNPLFHTKTNKPWAYNDLEYLINWYDIVGPEEMSYALSRTIKSIAQMVNNKRNDGTMIKPLKQVKVKRIKKRPSAKGPNQNISMTLYHSLNK
jgi:hypothetical protein